MAEERADIVVTDKVDSGVEKKLRAIGSASESSFTSVQKLKGALADINVSAVTKLQAAISANTNALARETNAQARLTAARAQSTIADARAATEAQRLATETARTEAAQMRAAQAAAASAKAQLALAEAQRKATTATTQATQAADTAINTGTKTRNQNANIIAQLNDIGVSLAGGQNPLLVLIQQGSQLSYIAGTMNGGMMALLRTIAAMLAPFAVLAGVVGVLALQFKFWNDQVADDANMKKYAAGLGLTAKEMKELENVTVTSGDMMLGVWDTIKEAMNLSENFNSLKNWAKDAVDFIWRVLKNFAFGMVGLFSGMFELVRQVFTNLPAIIIDAVTQAANGAIDAINWLAQKSNEIVGTDFGKIDQLTNKHSGAMAKAWNATSAAALKGFKDAENGYNAFVERSEQNATKRAQRRLSAQAKKIIEDRGPGRKPKEDHTAERRAHALDMVNLKLDDELKRMKLLKDERAIQQRMDQIEEQLAQKKIKLNDAERASILAKVTAIEQYKYVQSESDRIHEASVAPLRTLNAANEAATALYDQKKISLQQLQGEQIRANRAYEEATNPLFAMEEALKASETAARLYGVAAEKNAYLEQIRQAFLAKNIPLYDIETGKINAKAAALIAQNDALRQQQQIQSVVGAIVNPMLEEQQMLANKQLYYDEIERMRQDDLLSEQQAQQARFGLDAKFTEMRLSNYSKMFGQMAGLASSGNKKLAAIGKAAAVAQALIDGYAAVQKALASAPPPLNFAMAAVVGLQTGMNVSKIMSTNVGSFATGGQFMVDGRSGVDANNINMNVTRGERVTIETPAQQRANDNANGSAAPNVNVKSINYFDEKSFIGAMDSADGDVIFTNYIRRNKSDVAAMLGVPQ